MDVIICVRMSIFMSIYVYMCFSVCVSLCAWALVYVYVCMYVYIYVPDAFFPCSLAVFHGLEFGVLCLESIDLQSETRFQNYATVSAALQD